MSSSEESFELSSSSDSSPDSDDILSTVPQLSDELEYFGLQPLPQLPNDEGQMPMNEQVASLVAALIDAIWNLIQIHQSTVRQHDEAEDTRHRLADDNKNLRAQVDNLKKELLTKDRQLAIATENEQRLVSECERLQQDIKKEKEEVRRLLNQVSQRDTHHAHELRKKEHEVLHVQEQLRHNLGLPRSSIRQSHNQKNRETGSCMGDASLKHQEEYKMSEEQEELYKKVIYKFEQNNRALIQENTNLRDIFCKFHMNLGHMAKRFAVFMEKNFKSDELGAECKTELKILPSSIFKMPFDDIREYNKDLHIEADKYMAVLETALEKLDQSMDMHCTS